VRCMHGRRVRWGSPRSRLQKGRGEEDWVACMGRFRRLWEMGERLVKDGWVKACMKEGKRRSACAYACIIMYVHVHVYMYVCFRVCMCDDSHPLHLSRHDDEKCLSRLPLPVDQLTVV